MNEYIAHFKIAVKEQFRYFFSDTFLGGLSILAFVTVTILFWQGTGETLFFGIYTWPMMVWYLLFTQITNSAIPNVVQYINADIREGRLATAMVRPYHYIGSVLTMKYGNAIINICTAFLMTFPIGYMFAGELPNWSNVLIAIPFILFAVLLSFLVSSVIGLIAFWTEDARPYSWIYQKIVFVFGGLLFPLDLLPGMFQSIVKVLPPAFFVYYPARLVVDYSPRLLMITAIGQILYLVLLIGLVVFLYDLGKKKVSINGG